MAREELINFGKRVKNIRKQLHISQREFSENLCISASFLSDVEAGKTKAGYEFLKNITIHYNINPYYLHLGEGDMFLQPGGKTSTPEIDYGENSDLINEMLDYFKRSPVVRLSVLQYFKTYLFEKSEMIEAEMEKFKEKKKLEKKE